MHPTYYRGCWHVVSRCLFFRYRQQDRVLSGPFSSLTKELYNPRAFFTHAALLDQGCPHCPKFPTAASRRSLGRVSVPMWLIVLSDQLLIIALVGRYPTNKLISHRPLVWREARGSPAFLRGAYAVLANLSAGCPPPHGTFRCITHPSATRRQAEARAAVRLACVKHAASVQSEPGSNSSVQSLTALKILTRISLSLLAFASVTALFLFHGKRVTPTPIICLFVKDLPPPPQRVVAVS